MPIHVHFFPVVILTKKLVCGVQSVGLCTQDYKSLCAAATICTTLVTIEIDTQTDQLIWIAQPAALTRTHVTNTSTPAVITSNWKALSRQHAKANNHLKFAIIYFYRRSLSGVSICGLHHIAHGTYAMHYNGNIQNWTASQSTTYSRINPKI